VKHLVESAKLFVRWMDGTCIECDVETAAEDDEAAPDFSFYPDIFQNPHIIKMMLSLNQAIYRVFSIVQVGSMGT
jgi:dynein heavy chain